MTLDIFQVDAFASQLFRGNPAAVVPLQNWLPDELLQNIAAENNLSETAFFVPRQEGFHLRWFTPTAEVDLCGHATLATAHVLRTELHQQHPTLTFTSRSGLLAVSFADQVYTLDFPTDVLSARPVSGLLEAALGQCPVSCWRGREDILVELPDQAAVEALQPDFRQLKKLPTRGLLATAPGLEVDFVSRCFFPAVGVDEDPVTGSAHTTLTPFWAKKLGKTKMTARQLSRRGGQLEVALRDGRTALSGAAVTYLRGKITV